MKIQAPDNPLLFQMFSPRVSKGDLKKLEIIEATLELLATVGIEETSFDAIGKKLGLARSHIIYYFSDKEELFDAVLKYITISAQHMTVEMIKDVDQPLLLLKAYVDSVFAWVEKYPKHARVMILFYYRCSFNKKQRAMNSELLSVATRRIAAIIEQIPEKKGTHAHPAIQTAHSIQCLLAGYFIRFLATDPDLSLRVCKKNAFEAVLGILESNAHLTPRA